MHAVRISVLFTDFEETKTAFNTAVKLSDGLDAEIDVIFPQVVAFPLPLTEPPVPATFIFERFHELAAGAKVHASIHIYLCRDAPQTLLEFLEPQSVVVVGCRKRWFGSRAARVVRVLRKGGYQVLLAHSNL